MHRITDDRIPGLAAADARKITRWATQIAHSTGTYPWWHYGWKRPVWTLRDEAVPIVAETPVYSHTGTLFFPSADDVRRSIYAGRPSAKEKDAMLAKAAAEAEYQRKNAQQKYLDDMRPDALDHARSITRKRVSVMAR
jgi:hypothetical protein